MPTVAEWLEDEIPRLQGNQPPALLAYRRDLEAQLETYRD